MPHIRVPDNVSREVIARWPARAAPWLADATADVLTLCKRHSAIPVRVLPARFALVVAAAAPGRSLVLRSTADPRGREHAVVAQALAELDVGPQVHEVVSTSSSTCVVMNEIQPGTVANDCSATEMAEVLRPLVKASITSSELPSVSAWIRQRLTGGTASTDVHPAASGPTDAERARALALLDVLQEHESSTVCHGDVSLGNVLRGNGRLFLIDPRGMTGDVEYDAAVAAIKAGLDVRDLSRRIQADAARAQAWVHIAIAARV